jgi:hypothetical protein
MIMNDDTKPAPERVRQMFRLSDGRFYWRSRPLSDFKSERAFDIWNRNYARSDVIRLQVRAWNTNKYRQSVSIDGARYPILSVLWCWYHGYWPSVRVVRIDGNPDNNSFENLRLE